MARVAIGAGPRQTLTAFREAEAYDRPSLLIAYSHCFGQGSETRDGLDQQCKAVTSGHGPLVRYDPMVCAANGNSLLLDSPRPRTQLDDYRKGELRLRALANTDPAAAGRLPDLAQQTIRQRWQICEEIASRSAGDFPANVRTDH